MHQPATGAPRPGDPRDPGPRPRPAGRDLAWGLLGAGIAILTAVQLGGLFLALLRLDTRPTTGASVLGFLITVVWLSTVWWLVAGAWRRTVWGCPFHHTSAGADARRCARHALVAADDQRAIG